MLRGPSFGHILILPQYLLEAHAAGPDDPVPTRAGQSGVLNGNQPAEQDQLCDRVQAGCGRQSPNETNVDPELVVLVAYGHAAIPSVTQCS